MANLSDFVTPLHAMVPDAPTPALTAAYLYNARLFLRETQAWRSTVTGSSVSGTQDYTLSLPTDSEMIDATSVFYDDTELEKRTIEQSERDFVRTPAGRPAAFTVLDTGELRLYPTPDADGAEIKARAVLIPARGATTFPQELADRYQRALEYGAAATLCWQMAMPWKDPVAAQLYYEVYRQERDLWRSRASDGGMTGTVRRIRYGGL